MYRTLFRKKSVKELISLYEKPNYRNKNHPSATTAGDNFDKEEETNTGDKEECVESDILRPRGQIYNTRNALSVQLPNTESEIQKLKTNLNIIAEKISALTKKSKEVSSVEERSKLDESLMRWTKQFNLIIARLDDNLKAELQDTIDKVLDYDKKVESVVFLKKIERLDLEIEMFKNSLNPSIYEALKKRSLTITRQIKACLRKSKEDEKVRFEEALKAVERILTRLNDIFRSRSNPNRQKRRQSI